MEAHLVTTISEDTEVLALFPDRDPDAWLFASSSLGIGPNVPNPEAPWVVWNELSSVAFREVSETSNAQERVFQLFVYDEQGDFTRINAILGELRRVVKAMAPFTTTDGIRCSRSEWSGFSGNLRADEYSCVCRYGTARFVVSR